MINKTASDPDICNVPPFPMFSIIYAVITGKSNNGITNYLHVNDEVKQEGKTSAIKTEKLNTWRVTKYKTEEITKLG